MLLRPDRRRRGADPTLYQRMALFAVGAVLALAGILWRRDELVLAATVVLAIGLGISYASRRGMSDHDDDVPPDGPAAP